MAGVLDVRMSRGHAQAVALTVRELGAAVIPIGEGRPLTAGAVLVPVAAV